MTNVSNNVHRPQSEKPPYDALEGRSPGGLADPTLGDFEAKSVASGSAENLSGSTAEVSKVSTVRLPVPDPAKPDYQTSELYTDIKRMIARSTFLAEGDSALVAFWAMSTWFREALQVFPILLVSGPAFDGE